jgi:CIC family chloride channel protein
VVLIDPAIVQRDDSAQKLLDLSETSRAIDFIVVDEHEHYCGMVTAGALREALVYRESIPLLQVYELQRSDLPTVTPEETLDVVLDKFSRSDVESLTVLDDRGERIRGLITRSNLMRRYQSALDEDASE